MPGESDPESNNIVGMYEEIEYKEEKPEDYELIITIDGYLDDVCKKIGHDYKIDDYYDKIIDDSGIRTAKLSHETRRVCSMCGKTEIRFIGRSRMSQKLLDLGKQIFGEKK